MGVRYILVVISKGSAHRIPPRIAHVAGIILTIGVLFLSLNGCADFVFWNLLANDDPGSNGSELVVAPISVTVSTGSTVQFSASGGTGPYTFVVVTGAGTIDPESGLYTAPGVSSVDIVRVVDELGASSDAQVIVVE